MYVWTKAYENYVESPCKMWYISYYIGDDTDLLHASFVLILQSLVVIKVTNNSRTATGKCCMISNVPHHDKLLNQDKSQNLKCTNKSLQLTENRQMP